MSYVHYFERFFGGVLEGYQFFGWQVLVEFNAGIPVSFCRIGGYKNWRVRVSQFNVLTSRRMYNWIATGRFRCRVASPVSGWPAACAAI